MRSESAKEDEKPSQQQQEEKFFKNLNLKKLLFDVAVVLFAILSFSMTIFVLSVTVDYFSFLFSVTEELAAKSYLEQNYGQIIGTVYLSIFGQVIVVADTIIYFTKFTQKNRLIGVHLVFYLPFFICGIVAAVGSPQYLNDMTTLSSGCSATDTSFDCQIASPYLRYREKFVAFFIIFCLSFLAYTVIFHLSVKINQKSEVGMILRNQSQKNQEDSIAETKKYDFDTKNRYQNKDMSENLSNSFEKN